MYQHSKTGVGIVVFQVKPLPVKPVSQMGNQFMSQLHHFQSSPLLMAWVKQQKMGKCLDLLPWETWMILLAPGFDSVLCSHLGNEPADRRFLTFPLYDSSKKSFKTHF